MTPTIFITGGAGFIGSAAVRYFVKETDWKVVNIDCLTYAGNLESVEEVSDSPRYAFEEVDIREREKLVELFEAYEPRAVLHLAAESHVDRSIDGPEAFVSTNVLGTVRLLESARDYLRHLPSRRRDDFRFIHVSTDEVYGSLGDEGQFTEETAYAPSSPYAASKASSDHFVRAWNKTFEFPAIITNCSNNYGPCQFPEKLIPHMIVRALDERTLPIYGDGRNVRDWLFVIDHVGALHRVLEAGRVGDVYNIGGHNEKMNIEVVQGICDILDEAHPREDGRSYRNQIEFVEDRPGHDRRYAIDASKIEAELGWTPEETFESGLRKTVRWYLANEQWWRRVLDGSYRAERLGTSA